MKSRAFLLVTGGWTLLTLPPDSVVGQAVYAGLGVGPTVVLDAVAGSKSVYRQIYGMLGFEAPGAIGVRLEGAESFGFLWLSAELTYSFGERRLRPYLFAGGDCASTSPIRTRSPVGEPECAGLSLARCRSSVSAGFSESFREPVTGMSRSVRACALPASHGRSCPLRWECRWPSGDGGRTEPR